MYSLKQFIFDQPTKIICGIGSLGMLNSELSRLNAENVMIVCDEGIISAGIVDLILEELNKNDNVTVSVFSKIIPNPLDTTMDEGYEYAKSVNADTIIGVGGGSSLDSAKGIALLISNGGTMREFLMDGRIPERRIARTICIPTTAGTGSEVTRTIVATDHITKFKDGFKYTDTIFADTAILDARLMQKLPAPVLAACGMDALTHAIESYITWKANPITDSLNAMAIKLIGENIRIAYAQPEDLDAKEKLLIASCMTGIAFDQSGLGLAHCLGHPMGGLFNVPHGVACAMSLPVTMEYCRIAVPEKLAAIAGLLTKDAQGLMIKEAAEKSIAEVYALLNDLNLPKTLGEVGISEKDIPALAKDAMGFPGMRGASPRTASLADVEKLYQQLI